MLTDPSNRPTGVMLLSALHFLGGVATAAISLFLLFVDRNPEIDNALAEIGLSMPILIAGMIVLTVLSIGSALGMMSGAVWGWYLGSFYYAYAIVRNISALVVVSRFGDEIAEDSNSSPETVVFDYHAKFIIRLSVSLLIYLYFFRSNVREFFGLGEKKKWKAVVTEFGICVLIGTVVTVWSKSVQ